MVNSELKIKLRKATAADIDEYIELEKKVSSKTYAALLSREEATREMDEYKIYLFCDGGKTIGHISFKVKEGGVVHLGGFAIDPKYQGKGYGRKAMELFFELAKDAPEIHLVTHPDNFRAIKLYKSFGFKIVGRKENYFGDGEPRIILVRDRFPRR